MIDFVKMQGLGNDFMIINALSAPFNSSTLSLQQWANRRLGVGFDQLLTIEPPRSEGTDFYCSIYNADGSSAEQCGNGVRCVGRRIIDDRLLDADRPIRLETKGGVIELVGLPNGDIKVNMGEPIFEPSKLPARLSTEAPFYEYDFSGHSQRFSLVSMGNPHATVQVDAIDHAEFIRTGQSLGRSTLFPEGINVGVYQVLSKTQLSLRVYERGAGETMACGSGACAAMVAARRLGLLDQRAYVDQPGGTLVIEWSGIGGVVWMSGPAETVFLGQVVAP